MLCQTVQNLKVFLLKSESQELNNEFSAMRPRKSSQKHPHAQSNPRKPTKEPSSAEASAKLSCSLGPSLELVNFHSEVPTT